jgi:ubiquitin carboxyl-terminal hydrolase 34
MTCYSFVVLIEASAHDHSFWEVTKKHAQFEHLILSLLLQEHRQPVRREIAENIKVVCGLSKSQKKAPRPEGKDAEGMEQFENPTNLDIIATIWSAFVHNMRHTVEYAEQSREFFAVALAVFRSVAERSPHDVIFAEYLFQWSEIMLNHETEEVTSYSSVSHHNMLANKESSMSGVSQ